MAKPKVPKRKAQIKPVKKKKVASNKSNKTKNGAMKYTMKAG